MNIIFLEKNSNEKVQLQPHAKHTITAKAGDVYQLIDSNIQLSPLDIQAHRKSDDLILSSKEQNIEVVIKDFWLECQPGEQQCYAILNVLDSNGVMGQATITQDGPVLEHLVAGEAGTLSDNDDEIGLFLWVAGSIGSALAIFLANRNHGGGNGVVDTTPVVTIPEATDGVNADELKDGVQTEVSVPGGSAAGDTLTLTITKPDDSIETVEHTLTADEVTAGKANVIIPADEVTADGNYSVTAEITDPAGNTSGQGKPTDFMVDTQIPGDTDGDGVVDTTPVVTIPEATDGVNADELKDGVQTEVTVPGGSAAGDTLTLTITKPDGSTDTVEHTLTADEVTAG
ncbi:RTX toxin, partial [Proteus mirabilis]|uniref:Ig-like domain-containing protein n=1 Tax=Proteus mirabilis TaxID=584 RepID=UPI000E079A5C